MADRTLTAMYDTHGAAEAARDGLVSLGVPSAEISIRGTEGGSATAAAPEEDKGFWASVGDLFAPEEDRYTYAEGLRRGGYLLSARVPDGLEDQALDVLERSEPVDLDERSETWRQSGWQGYATGTSGGAGYATAGATAGLAEGGTTGYATSERQAGSTGVIGEGTAAYGATARPAGDEDVLQVAEEQVKVGKREVGRGSVRVRSYITERPVEEQVSLRDETVRVERRPVDRPVEAGDAVFKERTIEVAERDEEAVISKEARVVEEIGLRKDVDTHVETVRDTVRKQEVEIEDDRAAGGVTGTDRLTTTRERDRTDR